MIVVENLSKHFGGIKAVDNVSLSIAPGSITGLIGPNGAGKTTLFNVIAGLHAPTSG
ncbi:MAG: ATP-binding cassette domain-containing protein, partial [Rhodobiaceae bacterium]